MIIQQLKSTVPEALEQARSADVARLKYTDFKSKAFPGL